MADKPQPPSLPSTRPLDEAEALRSAADRVAFVKENVQGVFDKCEGQSIPDLQRAGGLLSPSLLHQWKDWEEKCQKLLGDLGGENDQLSQMAANKFAEYQQSLQDYHYALKQYQLDFADN